MSFMESPRFPETISYGVTFGPEFVTEVAGNDTGNEARNSKRSRGLGRGECAHAIRTAAELATLVKFFRSVRGKWIGFRFKDWSDYQLAEADSSFTLVFGTVNQYQVNKLYQAAVGYSETRPLRKPVVGTLVLKDAGTTVTAGAGAGQYSFDTTTGIFTQVASQTRSVSTHVVGAAHKFTLSSALSPNVAVGQKVAISGVTGTAAALLNGLLHTVTIVSGADVTVSTATSGLTATGGTLSLYRQQTTMTASCEFDTPCRFDTDHLPARIESVAAYTWGQIPVQEIVV